MSLVSKPDKVPAAQTAFQVAGAHTYAKGENATVFLAILGGMSVLGLPVLLNGLDNMMWGKSKRQPGE